MSSRIAALQGALQRTGHLHLGPPVAAAPSRHRSPSPEPADGGATDSCEPPVAANGSSAGLGGSCPNKTRARAPHRYPARPRAPSAEDAMGASPSPRGFGEPAGPDSFVARAEREFRGARESPAPPSGVAPAVTALAAEDEPGALIVWWSLPSGDAEALAGDWVALFIHDREFRYSAWASTCGQRCGVQRFTGLMNGFYDVRYFHSEEGCSTCAYRSAPVLIGPAVTGLSAEVVLPRAVRVTWDKPAASGDWVGLYKEGTRSNRQYLSYSWAADGSVLCELEAPYEQGRYEIRYFFSSGPLAAFIARGFLAYSGRTTVEIANHDKLQAQLLPGGKLIVNWECHSHKCSSSDWMGLYGSATTASTAYVTYNWTCRGRLDESGESGVMEFDLAKVAGEVREVRFFSASFGKYTPVMRLIVPPPL